jgi:hypothetical protein
MKNIFGSISKVRVYLKIFLRWRHGTRRLRARLAQASVWFTHRTAPTLAAAAIACLGMLLGAEWRTGDVAPPADGGAVLEVVVAAARARHRRPRRRRGAGRSSGNLHQVIPK